MRKFSIVFVSMLVFSFVLTGCTQTGTAPGEDEAAAALKQESEEIMAAYNAHDVDKVLSFMADDIEAVGPDGKATKGKEAFRKELENTFQGRPDLSMETENVFSSGNYICTQWSAKGTYSGTAPGEEALAGKPISFRGVVVSEVLDGKTVKSYLYYDNAVILTQLGILQPPPQQ